MATSPDAMMDLIRKQQPAGKTAPPTPLPPGAPDAGAEPMGSPMSTPEPKMGNKEGAMVNLSMAMDLIEQALPAIGSESSEGQKALAALRSLTGIVGPKKGKTNELQQSEIISLLQNLPQAGGGTPEGRAMSAAPMVPNMPPIPGAAPPAPAAGGAPPSPTPPMM